MSASFRRRGLTLIELLVALAVGSFLILGAFGVLTESRSALRAVDAASRLHENARYALEALEPEILMAGNWGLTTSRDAIDGRAASLAPEAAGPPVANDCGPRWSIDLDAPVEAANGRYAWACAPYAGAARGGADTLIVRRAARQPETSLDAGTLYVRTSRRGDGRLFVGAEPGPEPIGETTLTYRLVVNGYYVSPASTLSTPQNAVPSLRRKTLQGGAGGPRVADEEVLPGVEDFQIELGIDTDPPATPGHGAVDRFVHPDDPVLATGAAAPARIVAVRLWLLLRAELPEHGYVDTREYAYADRLMPAPGDGYRRLLVTRTVRLRNAGAP